MATRAAEAARRTEQLILRLTPLLGLVAGAVLGWAVTPRWGIGVAIGGALAWLNYRWLEQGVSALATSARQQHDPEGTRRPRVPLQVSAKFVGRYVLIGLAVYAIVTIYKVPVLSLLAGLFSLGAAALLAVVYEVLASPNHGTSR